MMTLKPDAPEAVGPNCWIRVQGASVESGNDLSNISCVKVCCVQIVVGSSLYAAMDNNPWYRSSAWYAKQSSSSSSSKQVGVKKGGRRLRKSETNKLTPVCHQDEGEGQQEAHTSGERR